MKILDYLRHLAKGADLDRPHTRCTFCWDDCSPLYPLAYVLAKLEKRNNLRESPAPFKLSYYKHLKTNPEDP